MIHYGGEIILADTSIWIDYFHDAPISDSVEILLNKNELCINDIILAELLPSIRRCEEYNLESLLCSLPNISLWIDWNEIISMQTKNLIHGINKIGLPDLIIAQNSIQHNVPIFSVDKHFLLMKNIFPIRLFTPNI